MTVAERAKAASDDPHVRGEDAQAGAVERERLRKMMLIRRFEERTFQVYTAPGKKINGFCHLYSGQEAVAVGIAAVFQRGRDFLINGYRDHGHSLALGMTCRAAMAELFGKATGCSKGKGGSMHFFEASAGNLGGHGIVGGQIPLGAGAAFYAAYKKTGGVSYTLFGDGAINQGTFNETLNLASLWKLPALFIVENNMMAMGTQVERSSAEKDLARRGCGYAMPCHNVDGNDLDEVIRFVREAADRARAGSGPSYLVMNTYRYRGHSMSDPAKYRTREEVQKMRETRDPIETARKVLVETLGVAENELKAIEEEVRATVQDAADFAQQSPEPPESELWTDVLTEAA